MIPDPIAIRNERIKLLAGFANALGLAFIGVGALAPAVAFLSQAGGVAPGLRPAALNPLVSVASVGLGVAFHAAAHYVLAYMRKAKPDDPAGPH